MGESFIRLMLSCYPNFLCPKLLRVLRLRRRPILPLPVSRLRLILPVLMRLITGSVLLISMVVIVVPPSMCIRVRVVLRRVVPITKDGIVVVPKTSVRKRQSIRRLVVLLIPRMLLLIPLYLLRLPVLPLRRRMTTRVLRRRRPIRRRMRILLRKHQAFHQANIFMVVLVRATGNNLSHKYDAKKYNTKLPYDITSIKFSF